MRLHRFPLSILALLSALALAAPQSARAKKTTLRLGIASGDTLRYQMDLEQEVNFQGVVIDVTQEGQVEIAGLESRGDTLQFTLRFSRFQSSMKRGDDLVERTPELNGVALRGAILPRGELVDVQALTTVRPSVLEMVKQLVDNFFPYLAEEPVEPGDTWTRVRQVPNAKDPDGAPSIDGTSEYTLDEFTRKDGVEAAKILTKGKATLNLDTEAGPIAGETQGESEAYVALENGRILQAEAQGHFKGTLGVMEGSRGETFRLKLLH